MAQAGIASETIEAANGAAARDLARDYAELGARLARRGVDIEALVGHAQRFAVALPSWGVGTGGTRFGRFPQPGEPRDVFEKLEDCAVVHQLTRATPAVSLHVPWDRPADPAALRRHAEALGLAFDAMNSNTFEDHTPGQLSYKFGSLTHVDAAVREQAIALNVECIELGRALGSKALTVWIGDGGNFPGQLHLRRAFERYVDSLRAIAAKLPADWLLFLEHKLCEPAFYSTVNQDWGTSYAAATAVGPQCRCLVDLGHHAPNVNLELIVARLIQLGKLGGFHFNDSKYGDDDLDAGSIKPFQLFLIFHELVSAEAEGVAGFAPAYLLDQSHNVTDPIESLIVSAVELQRGFVKAWLVDRAKLAECQAKNDALLALQTVKEAFETDVRPILAEARRRNGGAIDPLAVVRAAGWRASCAARRPAARRATAGGIVG
ncbi:MAG: L-rhamnose catabolism isomerase [Planctomycetes bacterium]|nr:L-rhamnose catabolism isomerase [Planctomycetota bacterium]